MPLELHIWFIGDEQDGDEELLADVGRNVTKEWRFTDYEVTRVTEA